jgi:hypothetical protein
MTVLQGKNSRVGKIHMKVGDDHIVTTQNECNLKTPTWM